MNDKKITLTIQDEGQTIGQISFDPDRLNELEKMYRKAEGEKYRKTQGYKNALKRYRESPRYMYGYYLKTHGRSKKFLAWEKKFKAGENG